MTKTYDVIVNQDGQKIRIYNQPEGTVRELGLLGQHRELSQPMTPEALRKAKQQLDDLNQRVNRLKAERNQGNPGGPVGEVDTVCLVDKTTGKVTGIRDPK